MDPTDLGPGTATWLGGTGTILLGGFLWLRRFLSKDATDRAMDNADIGTVRRLNELLDSERLARKDAEARADQFAKERNELAAAVGRMEGKIEALTGAAQRGKAANRAAMVLSELLSRSDARAGELAKYADSARIAGLACNRFVDELSSTTNSARP
ncbi:hypothetical protein ALP90_00118 [Pseudomonas amygdali pv. ulmi]|uniref:Chemotaxis protein n=1 Tax=Pseudomonas amygdali pv. ulmi TaxID=251720 RepID=A0A3M4SAV0_PSEA0|nr:DUF2514 family protein [Pseudomonas amygdali]RMR11716.1 hypothetical protein ALP90_00118 [Pseudomonas amygdali pv. ulmi]